MKYNNSKKYSIRFRVDDKNEPFDLLIKHTNEEWYKAKHSEKTKDEVNFLNSIKVDSCPYCGSAATIKFGKNKLKVQRYKCNSCGKRFLPLTGTIFDSSKIPISEWLEFFIHLCEFHSISSSSRDNRNAIITGSYRLKKIFLVLSDYQKNTLLKGKVYIDETFINVEKKNQIIVNGKKLRGISRSKIGIACGVSSNSCFMFSYNTSKLSIHAVKKYYYPHIDDGCILIHDEEKAHIYLSENLAKKDFVYNSLYLKKLSDKDNPLEPINKLHRERKLFLKRHVNFKVGTIQDWLNLFVFIITGPTNVYDKFKKLINIALNTKKRLFFRDFIKK